MAGVAIFLMSTDGLAQGAPCDNKINGGSLLQVSGEILAPDTCFAFLGTNTTSSIPGLPCLRMTAGNVTLGGNVTFDSSNCNLGGGGGSGGYSTMSFIVE